MKTHILWLSYILIYLSVFSACTLADKEEIRDTSKDIGRYIKSNHKVMTCDVSLQDSIFTIEIELPKKDAMTYRRVTLLEQCILIGIFDLIPQDYAVVFDTKPSFHDTQDTAIINSFHRIRPYNYEDIYAEKIDSELNPLFYKATQYILEKIKPKDFYAIDQIYQIQTLENYQEYNLYGPTFIFLVQARTIECRDTPEVHDKLDKLKKLQESMRLLGKEEFDKIADKLNFFIEMC